jgi:hypothetical protein
MVVTVAAKKIEGNWEGALVVDGKFSRSYQGKSLADIVTKAISPFLSGEREDGTEVTVSLGFLDPEVVTQKEKVVKAGAK